MSEDELASVVELHDQVTHCCVMLLSYVFENLPLEAWTADAVRANLLSPDLYNELFGRGEASGVEEAGGFTIERALDAFYELNTKLAKLLEESGES